MIAQVLLIKMKSELPVALCFVSMQDNPDYHAFKNLLIRPALPTLFVVCGPDVLQGWVEKLMSHDNSCINQNNTNLCALTPLFPQVGPTRTRMPPADPPTSTHHLCEPEQDTSQRLQVLSYICTISVLSKCTWIVHLIPRSIPSAWPQESYISMIW